MALQLLFKYVKLSLVYHVEWSTHLAHTLKNYEEKSFSAIT